MKGKDKKFQQLLFHQNFLLHLDMQSLERKDWHWSGCNKYIRWNFNEGKASRKQPPKPEWWDFQCCKIKMKSISSGNNVTERSNYLTIAKIEVIEWVGQ